MELRANYARIGSEINLRDEVYTKVRACRLDIEKSGHLSIVAAVPIPEVIVASSSASTGQGSFLLSLFLVCVVLACQLTLVSLAVSHAIESIFFLFRSTDVPRNFWCQSCSGEASHCKQEPQERDFFSGCASTFLGH